MAWVDICFIHDNILNRGAHKIDRGDHISYAVQSTFIIPAAAKQRVQQRAKGQNIVHFV